MYYGLDDDNRVSLEYFAQADADTIVNMTNHCYFNLNGHKGADVRNHVLTIRSDAITDLDDEKTVNGNILPVEGTPFDFRTPHLIGERIGSDHRLTARGATTSTTSSAGTPPGTWSRCAPPRCPKTAAV